MIMLMQLSKEMNKKERKKRRRRKRQEKKDNNKKTKERSTSINKRTDHEHECIRNESTNQSVSQRTINMNAYEMNQPINQSVSEPWTWMHTKWINQPISQSANQSIYQSVKTRYLSDQSSRYFKHFLVIPFLISCFLEFQCPIVSVLSDWTLETLPKKPRRNSSDLGVDQLNAVWNQLRTSTPT